MTSLLTQAIDDVDDALHQKARLAIMAALASLGGASFLQLKEALCLSDGNLSTHLATLERKGYVEITKSFQGKKTLTTILPTEFGQQAFEGYLAALERVISEARAKGGSSSISGVRSLASDLEVGK